MSNDTRGITAVIYDGVTYPITGEVGDAIIDCIGAFEYNTHRTFYRFPTTDGRQVILNIGQSIPIAFEVDSEQSANDK